MKARNYAKEDANRSKRVVSMRLTEDEVDKLDAVSKFHGTSRSGTVAWLVEKLMRDWPEPFARR